MVAGGPGDGGDAGGGEGQQRCLREKEIVQQIREQKHSRNGSEEQPPKERGPAIQITPCRIERGVHASINPPTSGSAPFCSVLRRSRYPAWMGAPCSRVPRSARCCSS